MTFAKMVNKDGKIVAPTSESFQAAAANADWAKAPGFYQILTDEPGAKSWPITAATFILLPKQPQDAAAAAEALKFFGWAFAKGGKAAEELDYIPMPDDGRRADQEELGRQCEGRGRQAAGQLILESGLDRLDRSPGGRDAATARLPFPPGEWRRAAGLCVEMALTEQTFEDSGVDNLAKEAHVSDVALSGAQATAVEIDRRRVLGKLGLFDRLFHELTCAAAVLVLLLLGGVIVSLIQGSLPAIRAFGFGFLALAVLESRSPRNSARWRRSTARWSPR